MSSTQQNFTTWPAFDSKNSKNSEAMEKRHATEKQRETERVQARQQGPTPQNSQSIEGKTGGIKFGKGIGVEANSGNYSQGNDSGTTQTISGETGEVEAEEFGKGVFANTANALLPKNDQRRVHDADGQA